MIRQTIFFQGFFYVFLSCTCTKAVPKDEFVPGRYLLELDTTNERSMSLESTATALGLQLKTSSVFTLAFPGVSVQLSGPSWEANYTKLAELPGVKKIYPVRRYSLAPPAICPTNRRGSFLDVTGVTTLRTKTQLNGNRIRVAVIDTGIDYKHPDLGGCFGPGCRVVDGYDFTGDDIDAEKPDKDPMDCNGHGTHVAGIIGANGKMVGIAPGVVFGAYKVMDCHGYTNDEIMLKALDRAVQDGMQVINLSLGISLGWGEWVIPEAVSRIVKRGVFVAAAAGNSGDVQGLMSLGDIAAARNVMAVASFNSTAVPLPSFRVEQPTGQAAVPFVDADPPAPFKPAVYRLAQVKFSPTGDACGALPKGSLSGVVALLRRGGCEPLDKITSLARAGAVGMILYDDALGIPDPDFLGFASMWPLPVVAIEQSRARALAKLLAAGQRVLISFPRKPAVVATGYPRSGHVSDFSAEGPSLTLEAKPDIGAVGGNVFSTWLRKRQSSTPGYAVLSGTSMASPMIAGIAALLLQGNPQMRMDMLRLNDILRNTAVPQQDEQFPSRMAGVNKQGAGMVNAFRALTANLTITPSKLSLHDGSAPKIVSFTVRNTGGRETTIIVMHKPAVAEGIFKGRFLKGSRVDKAAQVSFAPAGALQVKAGGVVTIKATITPPSGLHSLTAYSGYIQVVQQYTLSNVYSLPYLGLTGDYQDVPVLNGEAEMYKCERVDGFPECGTNLMTKPPPNPTPTTFVAGREYPILSIPLTFALQSLTIDLVDARTNKVESSISKQYISVYDTTTPSAEEVSIPLDMLRAKPGPYYIKVIMLKPLGSLANPKDVVRLTSPTFRVVQHSA